MTTLRIPCSSQTHDEYGFPYGLEDMYNCSDDIVDKPKQRKCGFCRIPGHTRRTCEAFATSELWCLISFIPHRVGLDDDCLCSNCRKFRKYNSPNPTAAYYIRRENARKKIKMYPTITVVNSTRTPIYIYDNDMYMVTTVESGETHIIKDDDPFTEGNYEHFMILDQFYGYDYESSSKIASKHVLKLLTIEYGMNETITITQGESTTEDKWKEAALKSQYLLQQLERLGVKNNPNYEPIMDMIQDIEFPEYSEQDKERSGVASTFTNVQETTGIDEETTGIDEE